MNFLPLKRYSNSPTSLAASEVPPESAKTVTAVDETSMKSPKIITSARSNSQDRSRSEDACKAATDLPLEEEVLLPVLILALVTSNNSFSWHSFMGDFSDGVRHFFRVTLKVFVRTQMTVRSIQNDYFDPVRRALTYHLIPKEMSIFNNKTTRISLLT